MFKKINNIDRLVNQLLKEKIVPKLTKSEMNMKTLWQTSKKFRDYKKIFLKPVIYDPDKYKRYECFQDSHKPHKLNQEVNNLKRPKINTEIKIPKKSIPA